MNQDAASALFIGAILAIGAVAVILYQHSQATAQILAAAGGGAMAGVGANAGGLLGASASLAGTPTVGQTGYSVPPAIAPLQIQPGYQLQ